LGMKDLARVVFHRADSAGFPLSPPVFFGLHLRETDKFSAGVSTTNL
jgi:hypothetical protein